MSAARRDRSSAAIAVRPATRCAVYCRKSTNENLDKQFNSLDAQREAAEAFIASQRGEGWIALAEHYDDGGWSGATTERPALKRLLADVVDGKIDTVVVHKIDRLSRSMRDFLNLIALFYEHRVSFVSVTQQFNTSTPVGRMTLRMLMSFAEFERDIIAERTRDKTHAARRRGRWTGGIPPLGYRLAPGGGRLIVDKEGAELVRLIFDLYIEHRSLLKVSQELNRRGIVRKAYVPARKQNDAK